MEQNKEPLKLNEDEQEAIEYFRAHPSIYGSLFWLIKKFEQDQKYRIMEMEINRKSHLR